MLGESADVKHRNGHLEFDCEDTTVVVIACCFSHGCEVGAFFLVIVGG